MYIRKSISLQNVIQDILQYEIYSHVPLNKTAQRNPQHCTKLHSKVHNEVRNVLHSKTCSKIEFSLCFGLREIPWLGKHKLLY